MPYTVLLFYLYIPIAQPDELLIRQKALCQSLNLKGRIILADEGINGTLAGEAQAVLEYQRALEKELGTTDIEWKTSQASEQVFPRMSIKVRPEIVTLGQKKQGRDVLIENKAHYIEPEELLELYEKGEDFLILDARNEYEARIGKFKNAIVPPIDTFKEFPAFAQSIADYKDKYIVTYCTGGIRCEKASAYLREQGFNKVKQLHGGVHTYAEKTGGKHFEGELFVFDKRLHMPVNTVDASIISHCEYCEEATTNLVDCTDKSCPQLFSCCPNCEQEHTGLCKEHHAQTIN